jgi:hypothetical protein
VLGRHPFSILARGRPIVIELTTASGAVAERRRGSDNGSESV